MDQQRPSNFTVAYQECIMGKNWASKDSRKLTSDGVKATQMEGRDDHHKDYVEWHKKLGGECYAQDVDQVEWRNIDGYFEPIAVLEITSVESDAPVPDSYRRNTLMRWNSRGDGQAPMSIEVGRRLGCPVYLVLFRANTKEFWVCDLTHGDRHWSQMDASEYADFLTWEIFELFRRYRDEQASV